MGNYFRRQFSYFKFFYGYLGNLIWGMLLANVAVALLDGIGLTMFLPLLQSMEGKGSVNTNEDMGNMVVVLDAIEAVGIPLELFNILALMVVFFTIKGVAKYGADMYRAWLNVRFSRKLRLDSIDALTNYSYASFSTANSGQIQNSLSGEVSRITNGFKQYFTVLQHATMLLVYVMLAYLSNPGFASMVVVGALLSNVIFNRIYKKTKKASRRFSKGMNSFQDFLIQSVSNFKYLKATNLIANYRQKLRRSIIEVERQQLRVNSLAALAGAMREPLVILIVVVVIGIQVLYLGNSLGLIVLAMLFFYRGLTSLVALQNYYNNFLGTTGSIDNFRELEENLKSDKEANGSIPYSGLDEGIVANDLSYSYGLGETTLRNISFTLEKNKTLGLAGGSGTGKTTLVNILCGLLKVEPGMLIIGGVDSADIDNRDYRRRIGYITQESPVFSDSIANNVSFWDEPTPETEARIYRALRLAHAEDFVRAMPNGIHTKVGINGTNLSGGQRQRIAIARELYRDIDILIMDEATSALDSESERSIQENIEELSGAYTMIVIAHRLSTIRNADLIIHLESDGQYEVGDFERLQEVSPQFREMVSLQSL